MPSRLWQASSKRCLSCLARPSTPASRSCGRIESERILPSDLYWEARATARLGYQEDLRRYIYEHLQSAPVGQLQDFQQEHVKGRAFKYLVLGSRHSIDLSFLEKIGPLRELSLEEIFGDS
jgi:zinc protease